MTEHPATNHSIAWLLNQARAQLQNISDSPRLDAELLLCAALEQPRTYLMAWPERVPEAEQQARFADLLARRRGGEPVAYILGEREFWSLPLAVNHHTLIPRPDTERLVELALERLPAKQRLTVADLGTGSGAIALALASERPACAITAVERSDEALSVARQNAQTLGLDNVDFVHGSWFEPLQGQRFDMLVSNPPYVASGDPHLQQGDVRFEPGTALSSGHDGLDDLRHISNRAPEHLKAGGWLLLEHGFDQGPAVRELLQAVGFLEVSTHQDYAGRDRVSVGRLQKN